MADDFKFKASGSGLVTNPVRGRTSDHSSREETSGRRAQGRSWCRGLCECPSVATGSFSGLQTSTTST